MAGPMSNWGQRSGAPSFRGRRPVVADADAVQLQPGRATNPGPSTFAPDAKATIMNGEPLSRWTMPYFAALKRTSVRRFSYALLVVVILTPIASRASETDQVCSLLLDMWRLGSHAPAGPAAQQGLDRLDRVLVNLSSLNQDGIVTDHDLGEVEAHASALRQHWWFAAKGLASQVQAPDLPVGLLRSYDCFKGSAAPQDVSDTRQGLESALKSDTRELGATRTDSNPITELLASSHFVIMAVITAGLVGLALQIERRRRLRRLQFCSTRALLVYGDNCTVLKIIRIGRSGALLEAPSVAIPTSGLDLYVAGLRISARRQSDNKFFLGLNFTHPISTDAVESIARSSSDSDQLGEIAKNATPCFFPGCHHDCDSHRATALAARQF